jgi:hypothetical protein
LEEVTRELTSRWKIEDCKLMHLQWSCQF